MPATPEPNKAPDLDSPAPSTRADADFAQPTAAPPSAAGSNLVLAPGQRPLPDYELVGLLGRGGFGEVWKARGPGGFHVALKFVRLEESAGEAELRALGLMKEVRHAHLLATFGAWQRDSVLVIAMELADGTLRDRLRRARAGGQPGIPRDELLEYLREAAKGLDFLNEGGGPGRVGGIQHKDIKPENLLLVGGTVKVGDFGLAKVIEHTVGTASRGMTPAYAAPEFFNAQATRWSDQYSLAVTYCQLRGGRLPFEGNQFQVMAGHVTQPPDLSMLPEAERPAVARALAKKPEERWPSCRAFAEALAEAGKRATAPTPHAPSEPGPAPRPREEGEALLTQHYREALERTRGKPTPEDRDTLAGLCARYAIPAERAGALVREARARWHRDHRAPLAPDGRTLPTVRPVSAPTALEAAPPRRGRAGWPLPWLLAGALPLAAAAVVGLALLAAPYLHPSGEHRATVPAGPGLAVAAAAVGRDTGRTPRPEPAVEGGDAAARPQGTQLPPEPPRGAAFTNSVGMGFVRVEPGSFLMGSPDGRSPAGLPAEEGRSEDEVPHRVTLTKGFYMAACLVTQAQWEQVLGQDANHSRFRGPEGDETKLPVDTVSWFDCVEFCIQLSERESRTPRYRLTNVVRGVDGAISAAEVEARADGTGYRLPSEAEWEYACRAGTQTPFWWGSTITTDQANYDGSHAYGKGGAKGESRGKTTPVEFFPATPRGLHDMGGNLYQWCEDRYAPYPAGDVRDPVGSENPLDSARVLRGGSWIGSAGRCRAAHRYRGAPALRRDCCGCRVVLGAD